MVPKIVNNNKTNIETLYQKITYFPNFKIIISTWYSHSAIMSNEEFIIELELLLHRIIGKSATRVILNFTNFDFFISPSHVNNYINNFANELKLLKIKKLAILLPSDNLIKIAIEQAIEKIQVLTNFEYKIFSNQSIALHWLKR